MDNSTHPSSSHPHTHKLPHTKQTKDLQNKTQRDKHSSTHPDVVAIQESKLTPTSRTPKILHYTAIRTDIKHKQGGGLITYIKSDTTFTHIKTPQTINTDNTEIQLLKIHTKHFKDITIANIYIAPRNTGTPHHRHYGHRHNKLHSIHHQHT